MTAADQHDGLTAREWADTARQAISRISAAEQLANLTHAEHLLRELPEIRDRILGPARPLTREHVVRVLDDLEAFARDVIRRQRGTDD
jgi:hypothetical protein